jgi:hypothetical protein
VVINKRGEAFIRLLGKYNIWQAHSLLSTLSRSKIRYKTFSVERIWLSGLRYAISICWETRWSWQVFEKFEGYHLAQVGRKINETVDFEKSAQELRTVILPEIDEELDQMKRTLDGLEDFLNQVAGKLSEKMPSDLRASLNVIYFPQIGFLVTVPVDPATGVAVYDGNFDNPWERMFSTE